MIYRSDAVSEVASLGTRPLIGITPGYAADRDRLYTARGYVEGVNSAGGFAVLLPLLIEPEMFDEVLDRFDGFLLSGGADIDARYYGEENLKSNGEISPYRDQYEIKLAGAAVECGKSVLAICRGIQVLNAALGGTLYQDIHTQIKDRALLKHWQEAPDWYPVHDVRLEKDTLLESCFRAECVNVNSFHHQAVKDVGKGLKVTAASSDGIIEALEHESSRFIVGVQWHPELMWKENREFLKLFKAFVGACGA
jgi:putative glutamine amidotransferase